MQIIVQGFWVLVWDGIDYSKGGLNLINPRLHVDKAGNNWWAKPAYWHCDKAEIKYRAKEMLRLESLYGHRFRVILSYTGSRTEKNS